MTLSTYLAYYSMSVIASVSVGPSVVLAASNGVYFGRRKALCGVLGHVSAILILALISASGVGALLVASPTAFLAVKYFGILYLIYIAYCMWGSKGAWAFLTDHGIVPSGAHLYRKSLLLGLSNPKALVFFSALFPQFIDVDGNIWQQFIILASTSLTNAFLFTFGYALAGYQLKNRLLPWLNSGLVGKGAALLFFVFAATLAFM